MNKENFFELFSRTSQPTPLLTNLSVLDKELNGVLPPSIVSIEGPTQTGKTESILKVIQKFILPLEYGGHESMVVLFDTDLRFEITRLTFLLEEHLVNFSEQNKNKNKKQKTQISDGNLEIEEQTQRSEETLLNQTNKKNKDGDQKRINEIVKSSLSRLFVYRPITIDQFYYTLLWVQSFMKRNNNNRQFNSTKTMSRDKVSQQRGTVNLQDKISLIVIDSISAFYWLDKTYPFRKQSLLSDEIPNLIAKIAEEFELLVFITILQRTLSIKKQIKQAETHSYLPKKLTKKFNYSIILNHNKLSVHNVFNTGLSHHIRKHYYIAIMKTKKNSFTSQTYSYTIENSGIQFEIAEQESDKDLDIESENEIEKENSIY
ncbi:DNA repair protein xrcc2 [Anaeramoeba flamelloides]|uniref:DNA repair protein xrcc2 n=1 Tax=Anaeramoeba flamelloides TaxID=1746091 RepID=A0ABQ8YSZ6_9EUKA|nr:DNA repair protein xrcc2 [Anaeramoeba flamelloides]